MSDASVCASAVASPAKAAAAADWITASHVREHYAVGTATLRRWHAQGRVHALRMPGGKRLYAAGEIARLLRDDHNASAARTATAVQKKKMCYARVSSEHQSRDLQRQIAFLCQQYPDHTVVSDVASGLNWKRPALRALLDDIYDGRVEQLVVVDKDRLCRFGAEWIEWLCAKSGCRLVVHPHDDGDGDGGPGASSEHELSDDLLSLVTVFVARKNGQRSARNRRERAAAATATALEQTQPEEEAGGRDDPVSRKRPRLCSGGDDGRLPAVASPLC